jgi:hypothetical protein
MNTKLVKEAIDILIKHDAKRAGIYRKGTIHRATRRKDSSKKLILLNVAVGKPNYKEREAIKRKFKGVPPSKDLLLVDLK